MTWEELNELRTFNAELRRAENLFDWLTRMPVSRNDGMPKMPTYKSQVEIAAIRRMELESEIDELKERIIAVTPVLNERIKAEVKDKTWRRVLTLRYVDCMHFRDIGFALGYSERHVYYLHKLALASLGLEENF